VRGIKDVNQEANAKGRERGLLIVRWAMRVGVEGRLTMRKVYMYTYCISRAGFSRRWAGAVVCEIFVWWTVVWCGAWVGSLKPDRGWLHNHAQFGKANFSLALAPG
jgi:hypothetical protein